MKITHFEIQRVPPSWVWLWIHTDEGVSGLGEPYLEGHPEAVIAEVRRLEPLLVGRDPRQIEDLWQVMYTAGTGYRGGPVTMSAISGVDIALWDIAGKATGLPVHALLGGACRDRVKMYRAGPRRGRWSRGCPTAPVALQRKRATPPRAAATPKRGQSRRGCWWGSGASGR